MASKRLPRTLMHSTLRPGLHTIIATGARRAQPGIAPVSMRELLGLRRSLHELIERLPPDAAHGARNPSQ